MSHRKLGMLQNRPPKKACQTMNEAVGENCELSTHAMGTCYDLVWTSSGLSTNSTKSTDDVCH